MSVTVSDLLKLPSLRHTKVIAGNKGLNEIVSSISVLEPPETAIPLSALIPKDEFYGGNIFLTTLLGPAGDSAAYHRRLSLLSESGAVGLIIFCLGCTPEEIEHTVLELADALNFPLICMPDNDMRLRYSEIIRDVMEAIFKDQAAAESIVVELLEQVSRLPQQRQTVDVVLKILSGRLRASVILTDASLNILNEAAWPRSLSGLYHGLKEVSLPRPFGPPVACPAVPGGLLYRAQIRSGDGQTMELFLIREELPIEGKLFHYAAEAVQLATQIWGKQHDRAAISELLRAIMQDEPLKMRRLADLFHIDIAAIRTMWVVSPAKPSDTASAFISEKIIETVKQCRKIAVTDIYKGHIVLLTKEANMLSDIEALQSEMSSQLLENFTLTRFTNLGNAADIREALLSHVECYRDARKIFPLRTIFYGEDIFFAKECRHMINGGEASVQTALQALAPLYREREFAELERTLAVYLLDTDFGLTETAEKMFLHKNTIKYRLRRISDCLGFRVGAMPASLKLYQAMAVERLLMSEKI